MAVERKTFNNKMYSMFDMLNRCLIINDNVKIIEYCKIY